MVERCTVNKKVAVRVMCSKAFPMQDYFTALDKRLARGILTIVIRHRRRMDDRTIYRSIMNEIRSCTECFDVITSSPRYESGICIVQRMIWAALAITEESSEVPFSGEGFRYSLPPRHRPHRFPDWLH
jgi:hypothetical protein